MGEFFLKEESEASMSLKILKPCSTKSLFFSSTVIVTKVDMITCVLERV